MAKTLDHREKRFVAEYLIDLDPKRAALEAGYSATMASSKAYQWVSNRKVKPHVYAAVQEALDERAERTKIDADWVLTRLADEADADMADLYDDNGALLPVKQWPMIWRKGLVAGLESDEVTVEGQAVAMVRKVKLSDRLKRIELIGKHVSIQAFREQVHSTGDIQLTVAQDDAEL